LFEPEQGAAHEEGADLVPAVVEYIALPVGVKALLRIGMLKEMGPVEVSKAVLVAREVGRHPVEDHTDAVLMQMVDEIHHVLRTSVPARRSKVPGCLVSPGTVEGVLHDGHELHMREARVLQVLRQIGRHLPVGERTVVLLRHPAPGTEVELIHGKG